jgi:inorganic triphosphatase YgiF
VTALAYLKWGGIAGLALALFVAGYHLGGNSAKTAAEALHAAQLSAVATVYQNQVLATQASEAQLQKVENAYDAVKDAPDPVTAGLATRVLLRACPASGGDVPQAAALAGRAAASTAESGGDPGLGGKLQAVLDACTADARQMSAMIELAPR